MENKEYTTNGTNLEIEQKIGNLIDSYMKSLSEGKDINQIRMTDQPDMEKIVEVVDKLQRIIFPGFFLHDRCHHVLAGQHFCQRTHLLLNQRYISTIKSTQRGTADSFWQRDAKQGF